ncbi:hypothetical protein LPH50_00165 [Xylella taiwanensis]|uniref:Uncharacterized protein n=1 Tax=Xylella taiwanensis TaxID=1444770 RepID=A0ABS8TY78_9GAMM|nr:furin-like repeat-containing protein [Xylella taiwanensis]MCD8456648.1 hypothetical protein [Xylella taiwanensis]MCD8456663.1 hypothetical protein [Xylella taiwanensis]MCD8459055.1 hypothetical protein [Xylella taiwanensis]MCD8459070.1 hypothetical protein [Xylella taiwanensis]MCD8462771.1 hypothetical protein [Xylella taiwanensis]
MFAGPKCSGRILLSQNFHDQGAAYSAAVSSLNYQLCFDDGQSSGHIVSGVKQYIAVLDHPSSVIGYYTYDTSCSDLPSKRIELSSTAISHFVNGTRSCFDGWDIDSGGTGACEVVKHFDSATKTVIETYTGSVCEVFNYKDDCLSRPGYTYLEGGAGSGASLVNGYGDCVPPSSKCPSDKKLVNGVCVSDCPAGLVEDQTSHECVAKDQSCPTGQVRAPDGSCVGDKDPCPSGQARGADGQCKTDADHDGTPDDEQSKDKDGKDKSSFSWKGSCEVAPSCSGDPVMCGQVRIQWRIECNLRRDVKVTGGACDAMPVCTGEKCNALEYASLLMQWRTACALEKSTGVALSGDKDGVSSDVAVIKNALTGKEGVVDTGDEGKASSVFSDESGYGKDGYPQSKLDDKGRGYSRSCLEPMMVDVFGETITFDLTPLCQWLQVGGKLVLLFAALSSVRIIAGTSQE